ncbi:MAG: hypothetical protein RDV48_23210 [Candidatus Eremiobacteraeota bacterium]|nr:hypothetical protein [Candidatus Eremiobacteraeota bacterium]
MIRVLVVMFAVIVFAACLCMNGYTSPGEDQSLNAPQCSKGEGGGQKGGFLQSLGLTEDQKGQLKAIREKHKGEMQTLMDSMSTKIRTVLTPDQQALWDKKVQEMKSRAGSQGGGMGQDGQGKMRRGGMGQSGDMGQGGGMGKGGAMSRGGGKKGALKQAMADLNLTDDQKDKVKTIVQQEQGKLQALRSTMESEMKAVLTPEQCQKFEEMKSQRMNRAGGGGFQKGQGGGKMRRGGADSDSTVPMNGPAGATI